MTQYFLHGGYIGVRSRENRSFFQGLVDEVKRDTVHVVVLPFARAESRWKEKFDEIAERFDEVRGEKNIDLVLAHTDPTILTKEIGDSDIVFIWGGETTKLQRKLEEISNFKEILREKIVAGSSAGALVFSKYYYENDTDSFHRGLGFLPFGMICHWKNQVKQREYLINSGYVDEVVCIAEGSFIIKECL